MKLIRQPHVITYRVIYYDLSIVFYPIRYYRRGGGASRGRWQQSFGVGEWICERNERG